MGVGQEEALPLPALTKSSRAAHPSPHGTLPTVCGDPGQLSRPADPDSFTSDTFPILDLLPYGVSSILNCPSILAYFCSDPLVPWIFSAISDCGSPLCLMGVLLGEY